MQDFESSVPELDEFFSSGWISDIICPVKSGKEATVYCCQGGAISNSRLIAAKVYRDRNNRGFKNNAVYQEGRVILDRRIARAVKNKSRAGQSAQESLWIDHEYETLKVLHHAGADVPVPLTKSGNAILMEFIGDEDMPAPPLNKISIEKDEADCLFNVIMWNIEIWLGMNIIHGDLSPFNILYWDGKIKVIDFPQAVDPRFNRNAYTLLERDIENVATYFRRYLGEIDTTRITKRFWNRFKYGEL